MITEKDWINVTKTTAIACYNHIGKENEKAADAAAVDAMRGAFNVMNMYSKIVIGEGERDEAPMLYIGEIVGKLRDKYNIDDNIITNKICFDIAVDPLEGTTLCAQNKPNAISVLAASSPKCLLHAPDVYMDKIAIGNGFPKNIIDLDVSIIENIRNLSKAKKSNISDICVAVLERDRHQKLIKDIISTGAKIKLFTDGDISTVIATCMPKLGIDMYVGIGGAPEGVLAAAAITIMGGQMQGRLIFKNEDEKTRARKIGIMDNAFNNKYTNEDMAHGDELIFVATGVTDGFLLNGVKLMHNKYNVSTGNNSTGNKDNSNIFTTHSLIISMKNKKLKFI